MASTSASAVETETEAETTEVEITTAPVLFLAVETRRNQPIGTLVRCATAFGVTALIVVGCKQFSTHGSHGSHRRINVMHFFYWSDCVSHLKATYPNIVFGAMTSTCDTVGFLPAFSTDTIVHYSDSVCLVVPDVNTGLTPEQIPFLDYTLYVRLPNQSLESRFHWMNKISLGIQSFGRQKHFSSIQYTGHKFSVLARKEVSNGGIISFPVMRVENDNKGKFSGEDYQSTDDINEDAGFCGDLFGM